MYLPVKEDHVKIMLRVSRIKQILSNTNVDVVLDILVIIVMKERLTVKVIPVMVELVYGHLLDTYAFVSLVDMVFLAQMVRVIYLQIMKHFP